MYINTVQPLKSVLLTLVSRCVTCGSFLFYSDLLKIKNYLEILASPKQNYHLALKLQKRTCKCQLEAFKHQTQEGRRYRKTDSFKEDW